MQSWDAYVLAREDGLGYQLSAFGKAVRQAYGFDTIYLTARIHRRICGILAVTRVGIPGHPGAWISSPYCDAGGILADSQDAEKVLLKAALLLAKRKGIPQVSLRSARSFAGIPPELTRHSGKARLLLDLPRNPLDLLSGLKAKVRSQVKKPIRDGLQFVMGGRELIRPFYGVFKENMRDLGSPVHSVRWMEQLLTAYKNRAHIGLVSLPDGTPAAGGLILCHRTTVSIPWASSLRCYNRLNPNMLLYWRFLEFACRQGFQHFDFGRSTPGEGTFRFKTQWGATPVFLHWADFNPFADDPAVPLVRDAGTDVSPARRAVEIILSKMPLSLATALGSSTRRFISL
ncbi:MAG TPA: peptidoglycan bridge formation protein FemAB [Desulfobacteraceae bacterium]|nr:peptidoglycan bridge formation protein FemAB [Desulfobacteraceae bacterium]